MLSKNIYFHAILIFCSLFLTFYFSFYYSLILIIPYLIYFTIKFNSKYLFIFLIFIFPLIFPFLHNSKVPTEEINKEGRISKIFTSSIIVKNKSSNIYLIVNDVSNFSYEDEVSYECSLLEVKRDSLFTLFLNSNKIDYFCTPDEIEVEESKDKNFRQRLFHNLKNHNTDFSNVALLLFYNYTFIGNEEFSNEVNGLGIKHLFVVSGFHIGIFVLVLSKIFKVFIKNDLINSLLAIFASTFFLWILYFPTSGIRAIFYILLVRLNRHFYLGLKRNELLSIVALIFLFFNPYFLFTLSGILSFSITAFINLIVFETDHNKFGKVILIPFISFVASTPFITSMQNEINFLAPILTIFMSPVISILFIFSLIIFPIQQLWIIGDYLISFFLLIFDTLKYVNLPFTINESLFTISLIMSRIFYIEIYYFKDNLYLLLIVSLLNSFIFSITI